MCTGFRSAETPPSPKLQDQEAGAPVEASVNLTANGATPVVALAVNAATGRSITVM
ncbi:hypothetical protein DSECCO2_543750 [anaerobic digester metagenome]